MAEKIHSQARQWLHSAADGRLSTENQAALQAHLNACPGCRAYATELDLLQDRLRNLFHERWDRDDHQASMPVHAVPMKYRRLTMRRQVLSMVGTLALMAVVLMVLIVSSGRFLPREGTGPAGAPTEPALALTLPPTQTPTEAPPSLTATPEPSPAPVTYQVKENDTCVAIAAFFNVPVESLITLNNLSATCDNLYVGQTLLIPQSTPALSDESARFPSPDGKWTAILDREAGSLEVADAQGAKHIIFPPGSSASDLRWSPDSLRLAVVLNNQAQTGSAEIWLVIVGHGLSEPRAVLQPGPADAYAGEGITLGAWTPDGSRLLFWPGPLSASIQADGLPLWSLEVETGQATRLSEATLVNPAYQSWSPDGSALAFTDGGYRSAQVGKWLSLYQVASGQVTTLVPADELVPGAVAWSPAGDRIAFAAVEASLTGNDYADWMGWDNPAILTRRIYLLDPQSGDYRRLNQVEAYQDAPRWSADGGKLYYAQMDGDQASLMAANPATGEAQSLIGCQAPLPETAGYYGQVDWTGLYESCLGALRSSSEIITYTVQPGDTIFGIADTFGLQPETILWMNTPSLGDDPSLLFVGLVLYIPPVDGLLHVWSPGESLVAVAEGYGVKPEDIVNWPGNHLDPNTLGDLSHPNIAPGTRLFVPGGHKAFDTLPIPNFPLGSEAINAIRSLFNLPEQPLEFIEMTTMINSPNGDLTVALYQDSEGRKYFVDPETNKVVEIDARAVLSSISPDTVPLSLEELRAKAKDLIQKAIPDFDSLQTKLSYDEGVKGSNYFFTWRLADASGTLNKPFVQIGLHESGELFAYYNTLPQTEPP